MINELFKSSKIIEIFGNASIIFHGLHDHYFTNQRIDNEFADRHKSLYVPDNTFAVLLRTFVTSRYDFDIGLSLRRAVYLTPASDA